MKITIIGVGKIKNSLYESLWHDYAKRLVPAVKLIEIEERRAAKANELLLAALPNQTILVALDEGGESLSSLELARRLQAWREQGRAGVCFIQGGADGLSPEILQRAELVLSFGRMTLPHMMARLVLVEQLYRAQSINGGHPYHRE
ncbi:MAG: 23S rRNA (pseudouridine(1915)-N(3))-methyltransferase RlmH [Candidatus Pacebacteria bacterium]|nr:23S rRNA (pseudouridine(1915)-N(3))-methyltransferase RlmH [Candidatus Paceibacterota bacterium]